MDRDGARAGAGLPGGSLPDDLGGAVGLRVESLQPDLLVVPIEHEVVATSTLVQHPDEQEAVGDDERATEAERDEDVLHRLPRNADPRDDEETAETEQSGEQHRERGLEHVPHVGLVLADDREAFVTAVLGGLVGRFRRHLSHLPRGA